MPLILQLSLDDGVTITVPPSATPTEVRVFLHNKLTPSLVKLGFEAPRDVAIVRDKAGRAKRRGGLDFSLAPDPPKE